VTRDTRREGTRAPLRLRNEKAFQARLRLGVVCLTALMTIVVGANSYVVGMSNKSAACIQHHVAYI
jgi:hypothetical protein